MDSPEEQVRAVLSGERQWCVVHAPLQWVLPYVAADVFDAVCTDPPYELGFMGRQWDKSGVSLLPATWEIIARVAKPGAHLQAFGGSRTFHRIACGIEDAGWEIRDVLSWLYGSGFPKSLNVAKAIDAALDVAPTVVGSRVLTGSAAMSTAEKGGTYASGTSSAGRKLEVAVTTPTSDAAKEWDGWGTALKPGWEPVILARKPFEETVATNVMEHGTGALNIDACRIATDWNEPDRPESWKRSGHSAKPDAEKIAAPPGDGIELNAKGRFPANVLLSHDWRCSETCHPDCPIRRLDEQVGELKSGFMAAGTTRGTRIGYSGHLPHQVTRDTIADSGGASRFFYCAKAPRAERDAGLEAFAPSTAAEATASKDGQARLDCPRTGAGRTGGARNTHPTVKPIAIMRWLLRLICRRGGLVLDPFCGSGTTGIAAMQEGMRFIGIELDDKHAQIARSRIAHYVGGEAEVSPEFRAPPPAQVALFGASR